MLQACLEIITVYSENLTKRINTLYWQQSLWMLKHVVNAYITLIFNEH
jgi:hypothetical protein